MNSFLLSFHSSILELKKVRTICISAMLITVYLLLHFFLAIQITPFIRVSVSVVAVVVAAVWFGPVTAGIVGGISDILAYIMKPTGPFFPGFTLNLVVAGIIYGIFLYQKTSNSKQLLRQVILSKLMCVIVIQLLMTPLWLSILYGNAYFVIMQARIVKQIVTLPFDIIIAYTVVVFINKANLMQK